ncbi:MAG: amidohydrolase [Pseudomonadales bacterium]
MPELKLALLQTIQYWHDPEQNRQHFSGLLDKVAPDADLVVMPEMFSTGFTMASRQLAEPMDGPTMQWLQQQAETRNVHICCSLIITENNHYFNRFVLVTPGKSVQWYDKRHLFRMADEHNHFSPGEQRQIFTINDVRICPQVCYDLRFPVFSRNQNDYDLLLFVANWPAARRNHWRALLTARAIENQCYVVGVNRIGGDGNDVSYSGDSGVIDFNGDWQADMQADAGIQNAVIDLTPLQQYREKFPAWRDSDDFTLVPPDAH